MKFTTKTELPILIGAEELQAIGFTRGMAYNILNRADAPIVKIGKRKLLDRDKFFVWLETQGKDAANN